MSEIDREGHDESHLSVLFSEFLFRLQRSAFMRLDYGYAFRDCAYRIHTAIKVIIDMDTCACVS